MVRDDGKGATTGNDPGLAGVCERVKIYGGEMSAGNENGGGFVLRSANRCLKLPVGQQ